jgi:hypothetical protein
MANIFYFSPVYPLFSRVMVRHWRLSRYGYYMIPAQSYNYMHLAPSAAPPAAPLPAVPQSTGPWEAGVIYSVVPPHALAAIAEDNEELWYGILKGKFVGVMQNHPLALTAVVGVSNNSMRRYKTQALALDAFNVALAAGLVEIRPY